MSCIGRQAIHVTDSLGSTSGLRPVHSARWFNHTSISCSWHHSRQLKVDSRSRLSKVWIPSGGIASSKDEDAHAKLVRAGFVRQAHSGIFHLLPLGHRVQGKIEKLIEKYMSSLDASKLDLSSISSEDLWRRSGRFTKSNSELFCFRDRKDVNYILSPTHEEEITTLIARNVRSYKELPIRLYQISRKYRDELRPRHGLLRSREFVMKDLYTFDATTSLALATYDRVCEAYVALFDELKIPYLVAKADSGDMGGNLSHEFHFVTPKGEDRVISCESCDYVANEELAETVESPACETNDSTVWKFLSEETESLESRASYSFSVWRGVSKDRSTLVNAWYPSSPVIAAGSSEEHSRLKLNTHAVKSVFPDLDPGIENAGDIWLTKTKDNIESGGNCPKIINLVDYRLPETILNMICSEESSLPFWPKLSSKSSFSKVTSSVIAKEQSSGRRLNLLRIRDGDTCPKCGKNQLKVNVAIELGHTFFLGSRYSEPLDAMVAIPYGTTSQNAATNDQRFMQMGCHGIGVSRMIGAVAETLADQTGLNWPRVIAPYEVVVVPTRDCELDSIHVYDILARNSPSPSLNDALDVILDDRTHTFAWKMQDADLIGYPIIIVVGKRWKSESICEVQCRRLGVRTDVPLGQLGAFVKGLLVDL